MTATLMLVERWGCMWKLGMFTSDRTDQNVSEAVPDNVQLRAFVPLGESRQTPPLLLTDAGADT